jgi:hypothetical protein
MLQMVEAVLTHVRTVQVLIGDTAVLHHPLPILSNNKLIQCNQMLQMVVAVLTLTHVRTVRVLSGDTAVLHHPLP